MTVTANTPYPDVREDWEAEAEKLRVDGAAHWVITNMKQAYFAGAAASARRAAESQVPPELEALSNQEMVEQFHRRIRAHIAVSLNDKICWSEPTTQMLDELAVDCDLDAHGLLEEFKASGDPRALRAHLIVEECGELMRALALRDKTLVADALADLSYVTYGTAVTHDVPLDLVLAEVHRSNMTKERQPDDPDAARVRDKGPNYSPPDIAGVLRKAGKL